MYCVPDLQGHLLLVHHLQLGVELDTQRYEVLPIELVLDVSEDEGGLAGPALPHDDDLEHGLGVEAVGH